jgi:hypothetical protein
MKSAEFQIEANSMKSIIKAREDCQQVGFVKETIEVPCSIPG